MDRTYTTEIQPTIFSTSRKSWVKNTKKNIMNEM